MMTNFYLKISGIKRISTVLLLAFPLVLSAQKQGNAAIDSMKKLIGLKDDSNKVRAIYHVATAYVATNPDSAMAYIKLDLQLANKIKWDKAFGPIYNTLGRINSDNGKYDEALKYFTLAYQLSLKGPVKYNIASNLNNIASLYQRQSNDAMSLEYSLKALKVAEEIKDYSLIGTIQSNNARIYSGQRDFDKALKCNNEAIECAKKTQDKNAEGDAYNNIAVIYHEKQNNKEAEVYYRRALALYRETNNRLAEAVVLSQMSLLYLPDVDKKLDYLMQARVIFNQTNPMYVTSITNTGNIGGTYAGIVVEKSLNPGKKYKHIPGNYPAIAALAEQYLNEAIKSATATGGYDDLSYFLSNLADLQEAEGKDALALKNIRQSNKITDSLFSQEQKNKIAKLSAQYEFQKKEEDYKQQQQIAGLRIRQLYLYGILSITIVIAVAVFLVGRLRIARLKLKTDLQQKEAEQQAQELQHRTLLSESELKAIRAQMNPHFIFNVLNSIESYIVENDSRTASRLIQKFAGLSRLILENSTQSMVTADREWKALKLYTELESIRFNNQFAHQLNHNTSIELNKLLIPPMLVQPLIENAIHHGLRNYTNADGIVSIDLKQEENRLIFTITDNGVGLSASEKNKPSYPLKQQSLALKGINDRIAAINSAAGKTIASFEVNEISNNGKTGTVATLTLPVKTNSD